MSVLAERLLAVHEALDAADLPHAFGGAIALAYCTQEPRGTRDLDVNIFVGTDRADEALDALPHDVVAGAGDRAAARRTGQVRVMWDDTPVDVFLNTHDFHRDAQRRVQLVPFEDVTIPVLGCEALIVFKAMFNRTKDWADIEAIVDVGRGPARQALEHLRSLLADDDPVVVRLADLIAR